MASQTDAYPTSRRIHVMQLGSRRLRVKGMASGGLHDVYSHSMTCNWWQFYSAIAGLFMLINLLFAALFNGLPGAIANQSPTGFWGAFFFSVETLATVGYGDMHPASSTAHWLATLEIFIGMSSIAVVTGLTFARFTRPRARIIASNNLVVCDYEGVPTLMLRAVNGRRSMLEQASAQLYVLMQKRSAEGLELRRLLDLPLVRNVHPMFALSWTLMHVINESSPLFGMNAADLAACNADFILTISGSDEVTTQELRTRHIYRHSDMRWNHRFEDMLQIDADGREHIDYAHVHSVRPLASADYAAMPTPPTALPPAAH